MADAKKRGRPATRNPFRIDVSVTETIKAKLEDVAKSEHRPVNHIVCSILNRALGIDEQTSPAPHSETPKEEGQKTGGHASGGATTLLTISLQPELKDAVKRIAKMERRTASNMSCLMLRDWIGEWEAKHPGVNIWNNSEEE